MPHPRTPPRPRLTIRVGVTGHRAERLKTRERAVTDAATRVLKEIQSLATELGATLKHVYDDQPPRLRIISPLADGTDLLVAGAGHALGYELQAPLPSTASAIRDTMPNDRVRSEFDRLLSVAREHGAVLELDGAAPPNNDDFVAVGQTVVEQSDVLLAVWDGKPANGPGGTGEVADNAARLGRMVVRIDPDDPSHIELRRIVDGALVTRTGLDGLRDALVHLLAPPHPHPSAHPDPRVAYAKEGHARGWFGNFFSFFIWPASRRRPRWPALPADYVAATRAQWRDDWKRAEIPLAVMEPVERSVLGQYAWADNLATYYANRYRSAFTLTFLLAPLAVAAALTGYVLERSGRFESLFGIEHLTAGRLFASIEILVLATIFLIIVGGRRLHWHRKWVDYRALAERLRQLTFLLPLGRTAKRRNQIARSPAGVGSWVEWLHLAVARDAGLVSAAIGAEYLRHCRALLAECELDGQVHYHHRNATRMHRLHLMLQTVGTFCFFGAAIAAFLELFLHSALVTGIAIVLPALGAAMHGIETQGDFHEAEQRSEITAAALRATRDQIRAMREPTSRTLGDAAEQVAELYDRESGDWHATAELKPLVFPA